MWHRAGITGRLIGAITAYTLSTFSTALFGGKKSECDAKESENDHYKRHMIDLNKYMWMKSRVGNWEYFFKIFFDNFTTLNFCKNYFKNLKKHFHPLEVTINDMWSRNRFRLTKCQKFSLLKINFVIII